MGRIVDAGARLGSSQKWVSVGISFRQYAQRTEGPIHQGHNWMAELLGSSGCAGGCNRHFYRICAFWTWRSLGKRDKGAGGWLQCAGDRSGTEFRDSRSNELGV